MRGTSWKLWLLLGSLLATPLLAAGEPASTSAPASKSEAASWPRFHGPNQDNHSPDTGLLRAWPEQGPPLDWTAQGIGHGYASVSIGGGRIFTAGNLDEKTVVTALDMGGKILWQAPIGPAWLKPYGGTRGTPTIDADRIYYESPHGEVVCLAAATGEKIWGLNILEQFGNKNIRWGLSESLLIDGDRVLCCPGGEETSMVALDKKDGQLVWKAPSAGDLAGYATPTLAEVRGLRMILTLSRTSMIGVHADTGELLFSEAFSTLFNENILQPLFHEGHVFVSGLKAGSVKWKINVDGQKASVEKVWRSGHLDNHHGGAVLVDGHLYASSCLFNSAKWICLNWETGEKTYAERGVGKGSLTYADGLLYLLHEKRNVGLVRPHPEAHEVLSRFKLPEGSKDPSWAHPVVCGGRLYLRHGDSLYAYNVRAR